MTPLFHKVLQSLERDRALPLTTRLAKGVRYVAATASAPLLLARATRVGARARTLGVPRVDNRGTLTVGDDLTLNSTFCAAELVTLPGGVLELGDGVAINYGTSLTAAGRVTLGHRVSVGPYCLVSDVELPAAASAVPAPVEIGDGVWLAGRVTVLPGTRIGAGSVITAGSVVSGDIPAGVVAGGIPARVLRPVDGRAPEPAAAAPTPEPAAAPEPPAARAHGTVVADFTVDELAGHLRAGSEGFPVEAAVAPFGQVAQTLMGPAPEGGSDFLLVWTRAEGAVPGFARLLAHEPVSEAALLEEVDAFCDLVAQAAGRWRTVLVPTWTLPPHQRGLGMLDAREGGATHALARMNLRLMDRLGALGNVHVLDAQRWVDAAGRAGAGAKLWYLGKLAFPSEVLAEAARDVQAALRGLAGGARKLLVLDLDDTCWGGIVGDQGWQNLRLGGHDSVGEAFVDFQRAAKALTRRGVVLGIVSKNEESVALEAIRSHPEMVLREADFVGWRINWQDKARNVAELAQELNLGLQSVVFIDDNPVERARVREALPEVLVPDWPEDKRLYPSALRALRCFDAPALSREDAERTQLYASEKKREALKRDVGSLDAWLEGLGIRVVAEPLSPANLTRAAQLFNKTNQLNLSTRRLTEQELEAWAAGEGRALWAVGVSDRFGDAGLTGLLGVEARGDTLHVVDFLLSCRVMGRKVEATLAHLAVAHARARGLERVEARYVPTAKNKPCLDFWKGSGFTEAEPHRFVWDAGGEYALPRCITLEVAR